jgi:hypothetical protein
MTDFSWQADAIKEAVFEACGFVQSPSVLYRPTVTPDGNKWCCLYGDNLQEGVAGFGDTPAEACRAFDIAWTTGRTPSAMRALKMED